MTAFILPEPARLKLLAAMQADLDDLEAQGVAVAVTAEDLVTLEALGLVVDVTTGAIDEPLLPVGGLPMP